jgi:hypothetical protein
MQKDAWRFILSEMMPKMTDTMPEAIPDGCAEEIGLETAPAKGFEDGG